MKGTSVSENAGPSAADARRKRLGQYFTGVPLARLLASLAGAKSARSVIDPFSGSGDMLAAAASIGKPDLVAGLEIDPPAFGQAQARLNGRANGRTALVLGDAFSHTTLRQLPHTSFDLVITNPPYVRYQSLAHPQKGEVVLPNAVRVRTGLIEMLRAPDLFPHLDQEDRDLLVSLASGYSGLADLAVPAWMLSAALTRPGGQLAMVVPESWLSRDYAQIVHYLLLRWFRIRHIVEDAHAAWFSNALVRTTLMVADRVSRRTSAFGWAGESFLKTSVRACAASEVSVVGRAFPRRRDPDAAFATALKDASSAEHTVSEPFWEAHRIPLAAKSANLRAASVGEAWLREVEPVVAARVGDAPASSVFMPEQLRRWLGSKTERAFVSLKDLGFEVGQGLRTGANSFFYVDLISAGKRGAKVRLADGTGEVSGVPLDCILPVIRWQEELDDSFAIEPASLPGRVLMLERRALPEDIEDQTPPLAVRRAALAAYKPMTSGLADHVRLVSRSKVPGMSAVKPNVRAGREGKDGSPASPPRWWYMLPPLASRHRPDIFIGRVNNKVPRAILNPGRQAVVDANFSSVWSPSHQDRVLAALALLNSAWCGAAMECMGAVMGGGALKLEATHLARLPLPPLPDDAWRRLGELGAALASGREVMATCGSIDALVTTIVTGEQSEAEVTALRNLRDQQRAKRSHRE
ncbi:SAM-dependent methyltransferase [Pseudoroseomonas cervicalis]|uniref:site-specific DNA-methyltransferase (adenine-specific) n=1 Tax=Pseudoroseomonas cervicalis ATCC 49957 TaxID=525371 RepID=D5RSV6_9PROT|nr:SAM-dependent methyltransferase [Pseudoroseomonas cervicalis]EFH09613.1 hypothetical protein HMPREF0731_4168 [Pseudoroseomonas cervicalis ATCC 49957]